MPQLIEVPGVGQVEFPDTMSDEDIVSAIKANSASVPAAPAVTPQPVTPAPLPTMEPAQTPVKATTPAPVQPATPATVLPQGLRKSIFSTLTEGNRMEPQDLRNIADPSKGTLGEATAAAKTAGGYLAKGFDKVTSTIGKGAFNILGGWALPKGDGRMENPQEGALAAMDQGASLLTAQKGAKAQYDRLKGSGKQDEIDRAAEQLIALNQLVRKFTDAGVTDGKVMMDTLRDSIKENNWDSSSDDDARVLSSGEVRVNPKFVVDKDANAGVAAIQKSDAAPEQKEQEIAAFKQSRKEAAAGFIDRLTKEDEGDFKKHAANMAAKGITDPEQIFFSWDGLDRNFAEKTFDVTRDVFAQAGRDLANQARGIKAGLYETGAALEGLVGADTSASEAKIAEIGREILASRDKSDYVGELAAARGESGMVLDPLKGMTTSVVEMAPMFAAGGAGAALGTAESAAVRLLGTNIAKLGVYGVAGAQGYGSVMENALSVARDKAKAENRDITNEEINLAVGRAQAPALMNAAQTMFLSKLFPEGSQATALKGGIAKAFEVTGADILRAAKGAAGLRASLTAVKPQLKEFFKQVWTSAKVGFTDEAMEEGLNQYIEGVITKASINPDKTWEEIGSETWSGTWQGGIIGGTLPVLGKTFSRRNPQIAEAEKLVVEAAPDAPASAGAAAATITDTEKDTIQPEIPATQATAEKTSDIFSDTETAPTSEFAPSSSEIRSNEPASVSPETEQVAPVDVNETPVSDTQADLSITGENQTDEPIQEVAPQEAPMQVPPLPTGEAAPEVFEPAQSAPLSTAAAEAEATAAVTPTTNEPPTQEEVPQGVPATGNVQAPSESRVAEAPQGAVAPPRDPRDTTYEKLLTLGKPFGPNMVELATVTKPTLMKLRSESDAKASRLRPMETESFSLRKKSTVTGNAADKGWVLTDKRPSYVPPAQGLNFTMPPREGGKPKSITGRLKRNVEIFREQDVIAAMAKIGTILSKSKARETKGKEWFDQNESLYDDAPTLAPGYNSSVYSGVSTITPDEMATLLYKDHNVGDGTEATLWKLIAEANDTASSLSKKIGVEEERLSLGEKQIIEFENALADSEAGGDRAITAALLELGDRVVVDGTEFVVEDIEFDDRGVPQFVTLKDGPRFGRQEVAAGRLIFVEEVESSNPQLDEEFAGRDPGNTEEEVEVLSAPSVEESPVAEIPTEQPEPLAPKDYSVEAIAEALNVPMDEAAGVSALVQATNLPTDILDFQRGVESGMGEQKAKASFTLRANGRILIQGFKNSDFSSGAHEIAHVIRELLLNRDNLPLDITPEDIEVAELWAGDLDAGWARKFGGDEVLPWAKQRKKDAGATGKWVGVKDGEWSIAAEEKFARGWERYLLDGVAPNEALTPLFNKIGEWMKRIYATLKGSPIDIEITPAMKRVFDKLMTRNPDVIYGATGETSVVETDPGVPLPPTLKPTAENIASIGDDPVKFAGVVQGLADELLTPANAADVDYSTPEGVVPSATEYSIKLERTEKERERLGYPPRLAPVKRDFGTLWDNVMAAEFNWNTMSETQRPGPEKTAGAHMLNALIAEQNPERVLTDQEIAHLASEGLRRSDAVDAAMDAIVALPANATLKARRDAEAEMQRASDEYRLLLDFADRRRTGSGRSLNAWRIALERDYSLAAVIRKEVAATNIALSKSGKPPIKDIPAERQKELAALVKRVDEATKARQEAENRVSELRVQNAEQAQIIDDLSKEMAEMKTSSNKVNRTPANKKKIKERLAVQIEGAIARLEAKGIAVSNALMEEGSSKILFQSAQDVEDQGLIAAQWLVDRDLPKAEFDARVAATFGNASLGFAEQIRAQAEKFYYKTAASVTGAKIPTVEGALDEIDPELPVTREDVYSLARAFVFEDKRGTEVLDSVHSTLQELYPDLTRDEVAILFTNYGTITKPTGGTLEGFVRAAKTIERIGLQIRDILNKKAPLKTGYVGEGPTEEFVRRTLAALDRQIAEEERLIDEEILSRDKTVKIEDDPEIAARREVLADKRRFKREVYESLYPGETALIQAKKAADKALEKRLKFLKDGAPRSGEKAVKFSPDDDILETWRAIGAVNDQIAEIERERPMTAKDQQAALDRSLAQAKKIRDDLSRRLRDNDIAPKGKKKSALAEAVDRDARIEKVREESKKLRRQIAERQRESEIGAYSPQARAKREKGAIEKRIREIQRRILQEDYSKRKRPTPSTDAEVVRLRVLEKRAKQTLDENSAKAAFASLSGVGKAAVFARDLALLRTSFLLGGDAGMLNRQAGLFVKGAALRRDLVSAFKAIGSRTEREKIRQEGFIIGRILKSAVEALKSPQKEMEIFERTMADPLSEVWSSEGGKWFDPHEASVTMSEDVVRTNLLERTPWWMFTAGAALKSFAMQDGIARGAFRVALGALSKPALLAVERANRTIGNQVRLEAARMLLEPNQVPKPPNYNRDIVKATSTFLGRGTGGQTFESAVPLFNHIFLATRWMKSRLDIASLKPLRDVGFGVKAENRASAKAIAGMYADYIGMMTLQMVVMTMLTNALFDDDDEKKDGLDYNPYSTSFGTFRIGGLRLNPFSGLSQIVGLAFRLIGGKKVLPSGEERQIYGAAKYTEGVNFLLTKANMNSKFMFDALIAGQYWGERPLNTLFFDAPPGAMTTAESFRSTVNQLTTGLMLKDFERAYQEFGPVKGPLIMATLYLGDSGSFDKLESITNAEREGKSPLDAYGNPQ